MALTLTKGAAASAPAAPALSTLPTEARHSLTAAMSKADKWGEPPLESPEVNVKVNELRLGFSNTTRNPEGILSHNNSC